MFTIDLQLQREWEREIGDLPIEETVEFFLEESGLTPAEVQFRILDELADGFVLIRFSAENDAILEELIDVYTNDEATVDKLQKMIVERDEEPFPQSLLDMEVERDTDEDPVLLDLVRQHVLHYGSDADPRLKKYLDNLG